MALEKQQEKKFESSNFEFVRQLSPATNKPLTCPNAESFCTALPQAFKPRPYVSIDFVKQKHPPKADRPDDRQ